MYYCKECEKEFKMPKVFFENHDCPYPHGEKSSLCPICLGENIIKREPRYCKCCGARLYKEGDYCNKTCKKRGEILWEMERQRKRDWQSSPLYNALKEVEDYNLQNNKNLSYGQYFAMVKR